MDSQPLGPLALLPIPGSSQDTPGPASGALASQERLQSLTAWMDGHLDQPLDLRLLEARAGCSRRTLQYHFRAAHGCTPMQWLRRRRLQVALERLQAGQACPPLGEVARSVGYTSPSAFSRDFKRAHGLRPSQAQRLGVLRSAIRATMRP